MFRLLMLQHGGPRSKDSISTAMTQVVYTSPGCLWRHNETSSRSVRPALKQKLFKGKEQILVFLFFLYFTNGRYKFLNYYSVIKRCCIDIEQLYTNHHVRTLSQIHR